MLFRMFSKVIFEFWSLIKGLIQEKYFVAVLLYEATRPIIGINPPGLWWYLRPHIIVGLSNKGNYSIIQGMPPILVQICANIF